MAEGMAFFRRSTVLPVLAGLTAGLAFFQAVVVSPFVLFALRDLHLSKAGYGVFLAVTALGNVAGGLLAPRLRRRFSTATILCVGGLAAGMAYLGIAATSSVPVAQAAFVIEAAAVAAGTVASISLRQRHIPATSAREGQQRVPGHHLGSHPPGRVDRRPAGPSAAGCGRRSWWPGWLRSLWSWRRQCP